MASSTPRMPGWRPTREPTRSSLEPRRTAARRRALLDLGPAGDCRSRRRPDGGAPRRGHPLGQDVLKALCLGARAVYIGRPFLYGLGAMGRKGVTQVLEIIQRELDITLALCGKRLMTRPVRTFCIATWQVPGREPGVSHEHALLSPRYRHRQDRCQARAGDTGTLAETEILTQPNRVLAGPPYPHADVEGLWALILDGARRLHSRHRIDALVTTTHAATAALIDADGNLSLPVLDYEHAGPDGLRPLRRGAPAVRRDRLAAAAGGLNSGPSCSGRRKASRTSSPASRRSSPIRSTGLSGSVASRPTRRRARLPHRSLEPSAP